MKHSFVMMAAMATALTALADDPVLMTIDGRDVPVSEFQYLYNKNNSQQIEPLTFDQYVDMFVDYKLKVADARAAGVDTTRAFRDEFAKYRAELAEPYLRDQSIAETLVNEAYAHMHNDLRVSHIMMPVTDHGVNTAATLDSLRSEILAGNTTFAQAAAAYSVDKNSALRGGSMGWIGSTSRLPWDFEQMAYNTPVGQISQVVNSGFGNHIILVEESRPARGEVKAEHILLLTQGLSPEEAAVKKQRIDSLYQVLLDGAKFSDIATKYSEDPGSARRGGDLGWFGGGQMVAEFDSAAFALPVGGLSTPFKTSYGYHIIHKSDARGVPTLDEARPNIERAIERDSKRARLPLQPILDKAAAGGHAYLNNKVGAIVKDYALDLGLPLTPDKMPKLADIDDAAYVINGETTTIGQLLAQNPARPGMPVDNLASYAEQLAKSHYDNALLEYASQTLEQYNADYANLVNEYSDGIMLFEVSNQKVWERASKDKEGLEKYFNQNRAKYKWDAPKFKSYVFFADNDTVLNEAITYAATFAATNPGYTPEDLTKAVKDKFGRNVKIERVIAGQGENAITDYLGFGAKKPISSNAKWSCYQSFDGRIIDAPETPADAKGAVVADYQNALEQQWLKDLHKKYKVKINKKVLDQLRRENQK